MLSAQAGRAGRSVAIRHPIPRWRPVSATGNRERVGPELFVVPAVVKYEVERRAFRLQAVSPFQRVGSAVTQDLVSGVDDLLNPNNGIVLHRI